MNLLRSEYRSDGIYGTLLADDGTLIAHTLEHAYQQPDKSWKPKLPEGAFTCKRGPHRLHGMTKDFQTFEIMDVPGHDNILFHWGNYNKDSEGCVLLGKAEVSQANGQHMITSSKETFDIFMKYLAGVNEFTLTVV